MSGWPFLYGGSSRNREEGSVDEALRVALRIMEERAVLTDKMADDARRSGRSGAADSYQQRAAESRAYADVLREAIEKS